MTTLNLSFSIAVIVRRVLLKDVQVSRIALDR